MKVTRSFHSLISKSTKLNMIKVVVCLVSTARATTEYPSRKVSNNTDTPQSEQQVQWNMIRPYSSSSSSVICDGHQGHYSSLNLIELMSAWNKAQLTPISSTSARALQLLQVKCGGTQRHRQSSQYQECESYILPDSRSSTLILQQLYYLQHSRNHDKPGLASLSQNHKL